MELLKTMLDLNIVHVPFKGSALSVNAMLAGEVQMMLIGLTTGIPLAKSGKARALAVANPARSALAPELPTIAEAGVAGIRLPELVRRRRARAHAAGGRYAAARGVRRALKHARGPRAAGALQGYEVIAGTPAQMARDDQGGHEEVGEGQSQA